MVLGVENWTLKDWLESAAYAVAILGAVAGAVLFLANSRKTAIESTRADIVRLWTNEGDIQSKEFAFIDLDLKNDNGDIIGTLTSPRLNQPLDVHADIGWGSSDLQISQLQGRNLATIATVKVRVTGNHNRLEWRITSFGAPGYLPQSAELWPSPLTPAR